MSKRPRVLLDVDGVLADYHAACLRLIHQLTGRDYTVDDITCWDFERKLITSPATLELYWKLTSEPGFCGSLQPYPAAIRGVELLAAIADIYIVTAYSRTNPTWTFERDAWLVEHFGVNPKQIVHTHAKYTVGGDLLIDDKPKHVLAWMAEHPNGRAILWAHPYNELLEPLPIGALRSNDWSIVRQVAEQRALYLDAPRANGAAG